MNSVPAKYRAIFIEKKKIASTVYSFKCVIEKNLPFEFKPGQYIIIDVGNGNKRHYSISSSPLNTGYFELIVDCKPGGAGSIYFEEAEVNNVFEFIGPLGQFILPENTNKNSFFLATGTGIAPLKSMIDTLTFKEKTPLNDIVLYWGTMYVENVILKDHFVKKLEKGLIKDYKICLSHEKAVGENFREGFVTEFLNDYSKEYVLNSDIFVCSSGEIVKSIVQTLKEYGILESNIYYERFS